MTCILAFSVTHILLLLLLIIRVINILNDIVASITVIAFLGGGLAGWLAVLAGELAGKGGWLI